MLFIPLPFWCLSWICVRGKHSADRSNIIWVSRSKLLRYDCTSSMGTCQAWTPSLLTARVIWRDRLDFLSQHVKKLLHFALEQSADFYIRPCSATEMKYLAQLLYSALLFTFTTNSYACKARDVNIASSTLRHSLNFFHLKIIIPTYIVLEIQIALYLVSRHYSSLCLQRGSWPHTVGTLL